MKSVLLFVTLLCLSSTLSPAIGRSLRAGDASELTTYIVHVLPPENIVFSTGEDLRAWHQSFLPSSIAESEADHRFLYSYRESYSGFAARLTADELKAMEKKPGFVNAIPDIVYPLLTTHTPSFLGLQPGSGFWKQSNFGEGIIIGVLDTGIQATHVSFNDDGVPPPPETWKGTCDFEENVCNNKLIGTRTFLSGGFTSSRKINPKEASDESGHGTHTTSTAGGNFVKGASYNGQANGTAAGVAPHAHVAMYKVCSHNGCSSADILAGLDAAIKDGVDVISISLGGAAEKFSTDPVAVGSFRAVAKGIFVSAAGGNDGPTPGFVSNGAPWLLTVAASTINRRIRVTVTLGDGQVFHGESLNQPTNFTSKPLPVVHFENLLAARCMNFGSQDVDGKVVVCDAGNNGAPFVVAKANGAGVISVNTDYQGNITLAEPLSIPGGRFSFADGEKIKSYVKSAKDKATIKVDFVGTVIGNEYITAPEISFFSSRGPNKISDAILKPDIAGPGVNILAAWPDVESSSSSRNEVFNIISGTSMATPHLSGAAALVKNVRPTWSPAAIKSAILTTAYDKDSAGNPIKNEKGQSANIHTTGSGHVDISKATDPGLVYDIAADDYIAYLCGLGYLDDDVSAVVGKNTSCDEVGSIEEDQLNYPNILVMNATGTVTRTVTRTVTNVGEAAETYKVQVVAPTGVIVTVKPTTLAFAKAGEKKSFDVTVKANGSWEGEMKWVSDKHVVRSVIGSAGSDVV